MTNCDMAMTMAIKHRNNGFAHKFGRPLLSGHPHHHNHDQIMSDHHHHVHASRDLVLAGEFGRELLQTNDELRAALERQRQESARRIEVLLIFLSSTLFLFQSNSKGHVKTI